MMQISWLYIQVPYSKSYSSVHYIMNQMIWKNLHLCSEVFLLTSTQAFRLAVPIVWLGIFLDLNLLENHNRGASAQTVILSPCPHSLFPHRITHSLKISPSTPVIDLTWRHYTSVSEGGCLVPRNWPKWPRQLKMNTNTRKRILLLPEYI